jgi:3-hydroxybutyryl-CoA dehydrogenase
MTVWIFRIKTIILSLNILNRLKVGGENLESPKPKAQNIVVVGSGLMGRGIGQSFATAGLNVTLVDLNQEIVGRALTSIRDSLVQLSKAGLVGEKVDKILERFSVETDAGKAASNASFVVEAINENLELKKQTFGTLDDNSPRDCVLASNTTSIPITAIASATDRPERVIGSHFWNPPQLMQAVEVVRGEKTNDETVNKTVEILKRIGKKPAVVQKDVSGQIGIRILYAMIREATWLVENKVASPADVDTVIKEALGTRLEVVGPLELCDLSGVDLVNNVAKGLYKTLDSSQGPQKIIQDMVARGEVGIKSGKGFYNWKDGSKSIDATVKLRDEHLIKIMQDRRSSE